VLIAGSATSTSAECPIFLPIRVKGDVNTKSPVPRTVQVSQNGLIKTASATIAVAEASSAFSQHVLAKAGAVDPINITTDSINNNIFLNIMPSFVKINS
jgi:hypothetical protein